MRSLAEMIQQFPDMMESGLSDREQQTSRELYGPNHLTPVPRESLWKKFLSKFDEPIIKILLMAALLSMVVDLFKIKGNGVWLGGAAVGLIGLTLVVVYLFQQKQWLPSLLFLLALLLFAIGLGVGHPLVEGMAVMMAVILATGVAFVSEYRSDCEFEGLLSQKDSIQVKLVRHGQFQTVGLEEVLVGDLIKLETGDEIPADGRLIKGIDIKVDQSLMTGESDPVSKSPQQFNEQESGFDQPGCLYRGTQVVDGIGEMVVTEVGDFSYLGQIARNLSADDSSGKSSEESEPGEQKRVKDKLSLSREQTPLQQKLGNLAEMISKVGYAAAVLIFLALLLRGILEQTIFIPTTTNQAIAVVGELLDAFVLMVIIIVVAVPEGLPMSVTVSLALAMRKMTRANSLVRQLVACETIGSATVICSDKTGTLTQNKMQVVRVGWENRIINRNQPGWINPDIPKLSADQTRPIDWIALNSASNSTAQLEDKGGKEVVVGNNTEGALLQWLCQQGLDYRIVRPQFEPRYQMHFSSDRKRMTTIISLGERLICLVKGAPEKVISECTHYLADDGSICPWTEPMRHVVEEQIREAAGEAMRTLAFAHAVLPADTPGDVESLSCLQDQLEKELIYSGFVAIQDPLRPDIKDALDQCRKAGIDVKMITGDNVDTARAIGFEVGLIQNRQEPIDGPNGAILTSSRLNQLSDDELKKALPHVRVVARALPLDKYRLVKLLQELGEVVAVTGDGTNDAPALKKADVGLAMGITGTEVAKEASKIVLLDDSFATIVNAVQWGRSLFENIQRFVQFQLTINLSALTIAFLGPLLFGVKAPFTVLQLLWINVIMDTLASIALCSEPPRDEVMQRPPRRRNENILTPAMIRTIVITACFFVVIMLGLLVAMKGTPQNPGFLAQQGSNLWSFESGGTVSAVPGEQLQWAGGRRHLYQLSADPDQMGEVLFTVWQVSLFFSVYVMFQVWNQINCRSLEPRDSGWNRLFSNSTFLAIATVVAVGQILIVTFGGSVFKVEPLRFWEWLAVLASTGTVLLFAEIARRIRLRLQKAEVQ